MRQSASAPSTANFEVLEARLLLSAFEMYVGKVIPPDAAAGDNAGAAVSISGDYAIVGAPLNAGAGAAYIYHYSAGVWTEQKKITASDAAASDYFGGSVAIQGDYAVVGAGNVDTLGADSGAAYVFHRVGTDWVQQAKLTAIDGAAHDYFGISVSIDGDRIAVGASEEDAAFGANKGAAYVFYRSGTNWTQEAEVTASDAAAIARFGWSVSLSGGYLAVGARTATHDALSEAGTVYIFQNLAGTAWTQEARLTASDAVALDDFGCSVSLSGDYLAVGADNDSFGAVTNAGSAYVFHRIVANVWLQEKKVTASDAATNDYFGSVLSLSGDHLLVGVGWDDDAGTDSGSAWVYERSGTDWTALPKLTAPDAAAGDNYGYAVAISDDRLIIGAYLDTNAAGTAAGSAYIEELLTAQKLLASDATTNQFFGTSIAVAGDYAVIGAYGADAAYVFRNVSGTWVQEAKLVPTPLTYGDRFGWSVGLSGDYAIVGQSLGSHDGLTQAGAAYIFHHTGGTTWTQEAVLTANDAATQDFFGWSAAISGDTAVVGAYWADVSGVTNSGAAYVFQRTGGTTWTQQAKLVANDPGDTDDFGGSVAISGDTVIVGAYNNDAGGMTSAGAAYVFHRSGTTWSLERKLTSSDEAAWDYFGYSVSLAGDVALVGALGDTHDGVSGAGSAYVFHRYGTTWIQEAKLTAPDAAGGDGLGFAVSLSGDYALVGAVHKGVGGANAGSAYLFHRAYGVWSEVKRLDAPDATAGSYFGNSAGIDGTHALVGSYYNNSMTGAVYAFDAAAATPLLNRPDLVGTSGWDTMGATIQAGDVYLFRVDVTNSGDATAMGLSKMQVWLSETGDLTVSTSFLLGESTVFVYQPVGQSASYYVVGIVPGGLQGVDPYNLVVVVDSAQQIPETDAGERNNQSIVPNAACTVQAPDLVPSFAIFYLPAAGPAGLATGTWGYALLRVANSGAGRVTGSIGITLEAVPVVPGVTCALNTQTVPIYLNTGTSGYYFMPFTLPGGMNGLYTMRATVDLLDDVHETNESNNTVSTSAYLVTAPMPDLAPALINPIVMASSTTVTSTGNYNLVELRVQNLGNATASGVVTMQLWASLDGVLGVGGDDVKLAEITTYVYLPPTATGYCYFSYLVPSMASGTYDLIAVVDSANSIVESNESNNSMTLADRLLFQA